MKKIAVLFFFATTFLNVSSQIYSQKDKSFSPFVGHWDWIENDHKKHSFYIFIGERNDSLMFAIGGIFYGGNKIHMPNYDNNFMDIADVRTVMPKGNKVKSKVSIVNSNFIAVQKMPINTTRFHLNC